MSRGYQMLQSRPWLEIQRSEQEYATAHKQVEAGGGRSVLSVPSHPVRGSLVSVVVVPASFGCSLPSFAHHYWCLPLHICCTISTSTLQSTPGRDRRRSLPPPCSAVPVIFAQTRKFILSQHPLCSLASVIHPFGLIHACLIGLIICPLPPLLVFSSQSLSNCTEQRHSSKDGCGEWKVNIHITLRFAVAPRIPPRHRTLSHAY